MRIDKLSIAIIGAGNMGGAIASALSENPEYRVAVYDSDRAKAEGLASGKEIRVLNALEDAKGYHVLLIAVKPQILPSIFSDIANLKAGLYISIAAGITLAELREKLSTDKVVRYMPNIAAKCRKSVTAVALSDALTEYEKEDAMDIAKSFGAAFQLEEKLFSAFIGISGSGIAYVFEMMHQMAMGGVREGIPYPTSLDIVRDTFESAISLQKESGKGAIELETMVCSAGGTTIEGVKALQDGAIGSTLMNAVSAAADKSRKMEKK